MRITHHMILTPGGIQILLYSGMRTLLYSFEKFEAAIKLEVIADFYHTPIPTHPWRNP